MAARSRVAACMPRGSPVLQMALLWPQPCPCPCLTPRLPLLRLQPQSQEHARTLPSYKALAAKRNVFNTGRRKLFFHSFSWFCVKVQENKDGLLLCLSSWY